MDDPVKFGFVASMKSARRQYYRRELPRQYVAREAAAAAAGIVGGLRRVRPSGNPGNPNAASDSEMAQAAAASLRLKVQVVHAVAERDFDAVFDDLRRRKPPRFSSSPEHCSSTPVGPLTEVAARHKLPVLYPDRSFVEAGGLMSYGSSRPDGYRQAGVYAGRILGGEARRSAGDPGE